MTKYFEFKDVINPHDLKNIKDIILNDGIVVMPTETVYGLAANVYSDSAINKVFQAKGRPNDNPLIVHISNLKMLDDLVSEIDPIAQKLIDHFWPGPLTIIFPKREWVSDLITAGLDTIGIRMPANQIAFKIIEACGVPLAAPSANLSGKPSGTNIKDIEFELKNYVDAMIDGGDADIGIESTVVKIQKEAIYILRPGKVTKEEIMALDLKVIDQDQFINQETKPQAPGMKYSHYAPQTKTMLVYSEDNAKMVKKINNLIKTQHQVVIIATAENKTAYPCETLVMGSKNNLNEISRNIFTHLRAADRLKADLIIIEGVAKKDLGAAVMNRLIKACSHNYVEL